MKFLKSLALSLMSFLLFLSLSTFALAFTVNQTVLSRDFIASELNRLDISGLLKETVSPQISQQLTQQIGQQVPGARDRVAGVIDATITELDPWMKKQTSDLAYGVYDYITGRSQSLDLKISMATLKDALGKNMRQSILSTPELAQIPAAQRDTMVAGMLQQLTEQIPSTLDLGDSLGAGFRDTMADMRRYVSYFSMVYWGLLGLMLLLAVGIVLVVRDAKTACRNLGTTFLTFGAFEYAGILVMKYFAGTQLSSFGGLPPALQKWLPQFLNDLWAPLETFSIAVGAVGLVLLIASFIIRRQPSVPQTG